MAPLEMDITATGEQLVNRYGLRAALQMVRAWRQMAEAPYTTDGPVRDSCGHEHQSLSDAQHCLKADQVACQRHGGYSDREVRRISNEPVPDYVTRLESELREIARETEDG